MFLKNEYFGSNYKDLFLVSLKTSERVKSAMSSADFTLSFVLESEKELPFHECPQTSF